MVVKPIVKALLLADHVYTDERTGKDIIAGTFDCLRCKEFPTRFHSVSWAYISITEIYGSVNLALRYVDVDNNEVLMQCLLGEIESGNPSLSIDFGVPVPPLPVPHEGEYALELHMEREILGSARIMAVQFEEEEDDDGEEQEDPDF